MKAEGMKLTRGILLTGAVAIMVLGSATRTLAQARPNPNSPPGAETNREMRDREANITLMERGKDEAKAREATQKQMNEDFQRIQSEDADMRTVFASPALPNYKKIYDDAADIKVRATRLKNLLVLPPSGKEDKRRKERESESDLKTSLPTLDEAIKSFVSNPIFHQQAGEPVDYRDVSKARRDLDDIIEFSSRIAKTAQNLSKGSAKSGQASSS
jgi:hypothetical protein